MGLTIHYHGRINDKLKLPQLIEELEEIARVHNWEYQIFENEFPLKSISKGIKKAATPTKFDGLLYGILLIPPGSEPVSFTFLQNGKMCGPMQLQNWGDSTKAKERKYLYMNFTKTQYAGPEIHKMVIGLFRYIVDHYLKDFEMIDEEEFWETNDEKLLHENFRRNTALINGFVNALKTNAKHDEEDVETFIIRVIKEFRERNSDSNNGKDEKE